MSRTHLGTSCWSYPSWRPGFYPEGTRPEDFLASDASRLAAVELNSTKYRLPSEEQFRLWASQVPDGFLFAVKAPDGIERRLATFAFFRHGDEPDAPLAAIGLARTMQAPA